MATDAAAGGSVSAGPAPDEDCHGEEMNTEERTGGAGYTPAHFTGAAPAALVGCLVSVRPAPANDGHGATGSGKTQREEGDDETPRNAREERDLTNRQTEERAPPERSRAPNASGRQGGEGRRGSPSQQRAPMAHIEGAVGDI